MESRLADARFTMQSKVTSLNEGTVFRRSGSMMKAFLKRCAAAEVTDNWRRDEKPNQAAAFRRFFY
jgi:hypothetical protein